MGDHPIAWTRCVGDGRSFYSAIGHRPETYSEPHHVQLLEQAIAWAAGMGETQCRAGKELPAAGHRPSADAIAAGAKYVAMGSSFAAGPGVGRPAETPSSRCARSADNYAQQLARKHRLHLIDVSCSGATTADVLGPSQDLPAQIDALAPDTALVTVTIGGNDVGFIAGLLAGSCTDDGDPVTRSAEVARACDAMIARRKAAVARNPSAAAGRSDDAAWKKVEMGLEQIAREVRQRSPQARLIFVDYVTVVPTDRTCSQLPLAAKAANEARAAAAHLAEITAAVAQRTGAGLVRASDLSREHHACAPEPWVTGFIPVGDTRRFSPYHPNIGAMTAIAQALDKQLGP